MSAVHAAFAGFDPVGLTDVTDIAALQTRVDRKYIVSPAELEAVLAVFADRPGSARVLEVDRRRAFAYESVYFDTPDLACYLAAARRRPDRFKVRTRTYLDHGQCAAEVKARNRRGQTVKLRHPHPLSARGELTDSTRAFLTGIDGVAPFLDRLEPVLTTRFQRSTLLLADDTRATFDRAVLAIEPAARGGAGVGFGDRVIIETKTMGEAGCLDRVLWSLHLRPRPVSKYGTCLAALRPDLPANRWHRTLHHLGPTVG